MAKITKATRGEVYHFSHAHSKGTLEVLPPCQDQRGGHWHCLTHKKGFVNNFAKDDHIHEGTHKLVWICHTHGPEEP